MDAETQNIQTAGLTGIREPKSTDELISDIENNVTYSDTFSNTVADSQNILCILSTDENPLAEYVLNSIADSGKPYTVMFATAGFQPLSIDEKKKICGKSYEKIADNIADNSPATIGRNAFFGITKSKTPVFINKVFLEADTVITLGYADNDPFYGLTGGPLLIFPGISSHKAIAKNTLVGFEAVHGFTGHNPVYDDCIDACVISRAGKTYFCINTLRDAKGGTFGVISGDLFMSHKLAMNKVRALMSDNKPECTTADLEGKNITEALRTVEAAVSVSDKVYVINCAEFAKHPSVKKSAEIKDTYGETLVNDFSENMFLAARLAHACAKAEIFCADTKNTPEIFRKADNVDPNELPPFIKI